MNELAHPASRRLVREPLRRRGVVVEIQAKKKAPDPVIEILKKVVDKSKETKKPTIVITDKPAAGKGGTGPKRPEPGADGQAKDQ